jgi:hypothetical protein
VRFDFPVPPRLLPGRQYALVQTLHGTGGSIKSFRPTAECPGGGFFSAPIGGTSRPLSNFNLAYQTFVKS